MKFEYIRNVKAEVYDAGWGIYFTNALYISYKITVLTVIFNRLCKAITKHGTIIRAEKYVAEKAKILNWS